MIDDIVFKLNSMPLHMNSQLQKINQNINQLINEQEKNLKVMDILKDKEVDEVVNTANLQEIINNKLQDLNK